jgi:hypothetical protein
MRAKQESFALINYGTPGAFKRKSLPETAAARV